MNWQRQRLRCAVNDPSSIWRNVKNWFGWTKYGSPTQLQENGKIHSKPKEVARIMNEFFTKKVEGLISTLEPAIECPLVLTRQVMNGRNCSFDLKPVFPNTVEEILRNLKPSSSCGLDDIDSKILKLGAKQLIPSITHILNLSITTKTFPEAWKTAKVIPLHKKDDLMDPKNYRPVSLLSTMSKLLERVIYLQLVSYLEKEKILNSSHHGFRKSHNTTTALIEMHDAWVEAFDHGELSAVTILDMSAAFDLVNHDILLKKLQI